MDGAGAVSRGRRRRPLPRPVRSWLTGLLLAQLAWHVVAMFLPGGSVQSCLPVFGHIARAGMSLAWASVPGGCQQAASSDARQIAAASLLSAVPLVLAQLAVTALGASVWAGTKRTEELVRRAVALLLVGLPEAVAVPVVGSQRSVFWSGKAGWRPAALAPVISGRGPPV